MSISRDLTLQDGRLEFVDALRGFALFGVFAANLLIFSGIGYLTDAQRESQFGGRFDAFAFFSERFFIENKFMGLFSFLFGISFWLFLSRAQNRTSSATVLFYRRIFWLFVIGAIHGWLLWCFDILRFYALWALLLPLFARLEIKRLLIFALTIGVLLPALVAAANVALTHPRADSFDYDLMAIEAFANGNYREVLVANWRYDWYLTGEISQIAYQVAILGRFLLGLYVVRTLDLGNLNAHRTMLRRILLIGGLIGLIGSSIFAGHLLPAAQQDPGLAFVRRLLVEGGQLGLTLSYASALAFAYLAVRTRRIVLILAPIGQMALTWFLFQTILGIWLFYGFPHGPALFLKVGPAMLAVICLVGFAAQIVLARIWMKHFRIGPAEWCWRSLTYWKFQPFRLSDPKP